jgi:energy-coupling factor transporter ATP-binding protein EcfA2
MSRLLFRRLSVRRMPGIEHGFELRELARGINVVFGPNASGKSTTARAIESLLWPRGADARETWLSGEFELDGARWEADLDAGRARFLRDGITAAPPHAIPHEARDRYCLPLHDLLKVDDAEFARAIAVESAGGYDLAAAARRLAPRTTPSRVRREQEELRQAREKLRSARALQDRLQSDKAWLRENEARLSRRDALARRQEVLRLAEEYARLSLEVQRQREELEAFHPIVAHLNGDEADRITRFRRGLEEARDLARGAEERVASASREIERLGIPAEILEGDHLRELAARVVELERIDSDIRREDVTAARARDRLEKETRLFGAGVEAGALAAADLQGIEALAGSARGLEDARASAAALEYELALLPAGGPGNDRAALERGRYLLEQWLQSPGSAGDIQSTLRLLALVASALVVLTGLGLLALHPLGGLLSLVGVLLLFMVLRQKQPPDPRPSREHEFQRLALADSPAVWSAEAVRDAMQRIQTRLAAAALDEERAARRARLEPALAEARSREQRLHARFLDVANRLGLPEAGDEVRLLWLVERIGQWQTVRAELDQAEAAVVAAWRQQSEALDAANQQLDRLKLDRVSDLPTLRARAAGLEERARAHGRCAADLRQAQDDLRRANARAAELEEEIQSIFTAGRVDPAEEHRLPELCAERPAYLEVRRTFDAAERERARLEQTLEARDGFEPVLLQSTPGGHQHEIERIGVELAELDQLRDRITELKRDIQVAKQGHQVEDALAEVERCEEVLREVRARDVKAAIAAVLIEHVEQGTRNDHLPDVFHRASAIFVRVTRGSYELRLGEGETPSFLAFDTIRQRQQPLEELSSATRLQLLLAVRIAFVEQQEGGVALPLVMDETLANSDDDRAAAIMDAVLELAAAGRQIFYFTSQPDEVRKWQGALRARPSLDASIIDLAEVRKLDRRLELPTGVLEAIGRPLFPAPNGHHHQRYGEILCVPPVDLHGPIGSLHLWYLVENPTTLHQLLTTLGAERWGAFQALMEQGGSKLLDPDLVPRLEVLGGVAEASLQKMKIGRGRKVRRDTLLASGAVSDRFLDEVAELCANVAGDARRLLERLENRAVTGFRTRNVELLRDFLDAEGFHDRREPLAAEQVRRQILPAVAAEIDARIIDIPALDRLLARIRLGAGISPDAELQRSLLIDSPLH